MSLMPVVETVPFRGIPHQSELYLDYLEFSPKALSFYARPPLFESLEQLARGEVPRFHFPRHEIIAILRSQNQSFGSGSRAMQHIQELGTPRTVAIVTGQQVGVFTGPLYTIYKAFTAIRIAAELRSQGISAVPIFWMDSEDHDLAEVTHVWVLGPDSVPQLLDYRLLLFESELENESARPVGSIEFPTEIRRALETYLNLLGETPFKEQIRTQLELAYQPGTTFSQSFAQVMAQLFEKHGLILFDAQAKEAKPLVSAVFQRAIREAEKIYEALTRRNRELEQSGYHTQVHVLENSTVLFLHDEAGRRSLTRSKEGFSLKNCDRVYRTEELLGLASSDPTCFSPNVLLRPLIQDHLFPTVAYVAGPAEIAYFAQIQPLYAIFGRPMPAIWPRASLTLINKEARLGMERYGIKFGDCLEGKHHLVEKIIAATNHSSTTMILDQLQKRLDQALEEIRPGMQTTDASLSPALDTAKRKILHHIEALQTKFVHLEAKRNQGILTEAEFFLNNCYPNKTLQERELSIHYFLARHGPSFMDMIYSLIGDGTFAHQVVKLD